MLQRDRRLTIRILSDELDIPQESVRKIVTPDLRKRCSRFVPHHLTEEQKRQRIECCGDFIDMEDENAQLVKTMVMEMKPGVSNMTGDETPDYGVVWTLIPQTEKNFILKIQG
ncbi:hypothetical protein AVEN_220065-1 [Araneus ventricosus]|uniref:Uncharacterized protein n=1 Tax=Araneus ventricosus TaxID=182803 RepID=A0A4Y2HMI1_ARAVE|nr:hypothetical protein AVEN_220065-1 [Araneus ventricosus]